MLFLSFSSCDCSSPSVLGVRQAGRVRVSRMLRQDAVRRAGGYGHLQELHRQRAPSQQAAEPQTGPAVGAARLHPDGTALRGAPAVHGAVCCRVHRNVPLRSVREGRLRSGCSLVFLRLHGRS